MADILDPAALLGTLPSLLPTKKFSAPQDALVALLHTVMAAVGFRLIGIDDASPSAEEDLKNILPQDWNKSVSSFLLKITKLGPRTLINGIAIENDKTASLDIGTADFTSASFFPRDLNDSEPIVHGSYLPAFKLKILQKLIPGLNKEGYTEETEQTNANLAEPSRPTPRMPRHDPEDDFYISPRREIYPQNPLSIGRRDLDPFPGINPFQPPPLFGPGSGDGMFVGPNHPIFAGRRNVDPDMRGPWGGDGFLPPMAVPPGARFDPIGPTQGPFPGAGRRIRGEPDNDEFMPPGARDMFM